MQSYRDIVVWFGGVLASELVSLTMQALYPQQQAAHVEQRFQINTLVDALQRGEISAAEYIQQAVESGPTALDPAQLEAQLLKSASVEDPVFDILTALPPACRLWLIVDWPRPWFEDVAGSEQRIGQVFPAEKRLYSAEMGLEKISPDIFYHTLSALGARRQSCLFIDGDSSRAVTGVRHGFHAAVYVYPKRLDHELKLRQIIKTDENVMHPLASGRIAG